MKHSFWKRLAIALHLAKRPDDLPPNLTPSTPPKRLPRWGTVERWRYQKEVVKQHQAIVDAAHRAFVEEREKRALYTEKMAVFVEAPE